MNRNLNMIPIRHQWARDAVRDMWANFWTPHEQAMGDDRAQLSELTPEEYHTFKTTLALLTTADVQIMDNVGDGTYLALEDFKLTDAPEIRNLLAWQAAQEALHNESYQHILESVLSLSENEQQAIYELWQTEPAMKAKVDTARGYTGILRDPSEDDVERFAALFFYYCVYEGGWFMGNFNPIFNINHIRRLMQGTVVQLRYIRRDESLHIDIGIQLLKEIERQIPGITSAATPKIRDIISLAGEIELTYAYMALNTGILGYSIWQHMAHFHYLMTKRCEALGISGVHPVTTQTPLGWLSTYELGREANFFESRVIEYQKGARLEWD